MLFWQVEYAYQEALAAEAAQGPAVACADASSVVERFGILLHTQGNNAACIKTTLTAHLGAHLSVHSVGVVRRPLAINLTNSRLEIYCSQFRCLLVADSTIHLRHVSRVHVSTGCRHKGAPSH